MEKRSYGDQGWWFFGALLGTAFLRTAFSMTGITTALTMTGLEVTLDYEMSGLYVALAIGLAATAIGFYIASRSGAPRLIWLMPLALSLMQLAGLTYVLQIWVLTDGNAPSAEAYQRVVLDAPFALAPVWWAAALGYPGAALLGSVASIWPRRQAAHT
jgi:hypothetical protein